MFRKKKTGGNVESILDRAGQTWFLFKNFMKVGYFRQLFFTSTLAAFLILVIVNNPQYLPASQLMAPEVIWKKTAFIGFWSTCTAAAGILGMARFQGVLASVVLSAKGGRTALLMLISPPALLGTLAFPLAFAATSLWYEQLGSLSGTDLYYCLLIILVGYLMTVPIAAIFLVSRHATTYELLILIPLLALSGILWWPVGVPSALKILLMPQALPIYGFFTQTPFSGLGLYQMVAFLIALLVWGGLGGYLVRVLFNQALRNGALELR